MQKTTFTIPKMDCPSEENMIRMKLDGMPAIKKLEFDISERRLIVLHQEHTTEIKQAIEELDLGGKITNTEQVVDPEIDMAKETHQRKLLWIVLVINFSFFLIEMSTGLISRSMGLVADSLDMLADAFVYGISLYAVGGSIARKKNTASLAGYFQLTLAIIGFVEVLRRFFGAEKLPDFSTMIVVSGLALIANSICLYLLQKSKSEEAHIKASMIFTSNDVIINLGVISAGVLVHGLQSAIPDLVVGSVVFILVIQGALRILKLGK